MKYCPECDTDKPLEMFSKNASRYDNLQGQCKECRSARRKADYIKNRDREISLNKVWSKDNPAACKARAKRHRQSEHGSAYYNAKSASHRATKRNATPAWLTKGQEDDIKAMYALAKKFDKLCNVEYHVDHIVPLAGKDICGLHVPWNLQLLPASINISKGNRYNG
jgi:5-methylcytosine-specific restriction endonuclease McrA